MRKAKFDEILIQDTKLIDTAMLQSYLSCGRATAVKIGEPLMLKFNCQELK